MTEKIIYVIIGLCLELLVALLLPICKVKNLPNWKIAFIVVWLTAVEVVGIFVMYWIENHKWNGQSFFGALLFTPLLILPAVLLKVNYKTLSDICAPCVCVALAALKIRCRIDGCCRGIVLWENAAGRVRFPSQIVEMLFALALMAVLIWMQTNPKNHGKIYGWFLFLYGVIRLTLNGFRDYLTPFVLHLPAGHFWSIISIIVGLGWILLADTNTIKRLKKSINDKT